MESLQNFYEFSCQHNDSQDMLSLTIDRTPNINTIVTPSGDNLVYSNLNDDLCDLACRFVQNVVKVILEDDGSTKFRGLK